MECLDIRDGFQEIYIYVGNGAYQESVAENSKTRSQPQLLKPSFCLNLVEFANIGSVDRKGKTLGYVRWN